VRGAARGVVVAALALALAAGRAWAGDGPTGFVHDVRDLDGAQFLKDEPIWLCDEGEPGAGVPAGDLIHDFWVLGFDDRGALIPASAPPGTGPLVSLLDWRGLSRPRAGEFVHSLCLPPRAALHPLGLAQATSGGLPAGRYEVRGGAWAFVPGSPPDTARVLARFRVLAPRGSELSVRAALARAARLASSADTALHADAARLYEAVLARYPRTSYRTHIYAGLWQVRQYTPYGADPGSWLAEVFAHFHSSCFGVWALDVFMREVPNDEARPLLRHLVGLYPDTKLARAAARYL